MDLFDRLETVRERWDVLRHPFYRRWSEGSLAREQIAFYAGEYRHAVTALAEATAAVADAGGPDLGAALAEHASEEADHVVLWDEFAAALDADVARAPLEETAACVEAWTAAGDLLEGLVTLYAIESAQPAISRTKLEGLVGHYGFEGSTPGTAYFELHAERDVEHAAHSRALIEARLDSADADRLVAVAERALAGNWALLDGVEARAESAI